LHYYRARFYDANLGRFISEDPIGFRGGDGNLFGYVFNNPQSFTDPKGLYPSESPDDFRNLSLKKMKYPTATAQIQFHMLTML